MRAVVFVLGILAVGLVGCGPNDRYGADANGHPPDAALPDSGDPPIFGAIYAHSYQPQYKADPDTIATVKQGSEYDYLARIDDTTGVATIIGPTGYADIWGLGYWKNKAYGFVATNQFVEIDVLTGAATYISTGPENWAGAGVSTR